MGRKRTVSQREKSKSICCGGFSFLDYNEKRVVYIDSAPTDLSFNFFFSQKASCCGLNAGTPSNSNAETQSAIKQFLRGGERPLGGFFYRIKTLNWKDLRELVCPPSPWTIWRHEKAPSMRSGFSCKTLDLLKPWFWMSEFSKISNKFAAYK